MVAPHGSTHYTHRNVAPLSGVVGLSPLQLVAVGGATCAISGGAGRPPRGRRGRRRGRRGLLLLLRLLPLVAPLLLLLLLGAVE